MVASFESIPCGYIWTIALVALFHVLRGAIGHTYLNPARPLLKDTWKQIVVLYIPDALLHLFSTSVGGVALWFAYQLARNPAASLDSGSVFAILSLAVFGLAGVTGVLANILASGKLPSSTGN